MNKAKACIAQRASQGKNRGIALLLMLSLLLVVFTTLAITWLSINDAVATRQQLTQKALTETRDAIMAWVMTQSFTSTNPPGSLPCPDINLDGLSDKPTINCSGELGFVPYRTLGIPEPRDGDGERLWYGVSNTYARNVDVALNQFRNSSLASPLFLNTAANSVAFVLISQNDAVAGQSRGNLSVANRAQFLEGLNADNNFNDYSDLYDQTHNDKILAVPVSFFWAEVEMRVLVDMKKLLEEYFVKCSSYPWAVPLAAANSIGQPNTYQGWLPVWGMSCHAPHNAILAPPFQPDWLRDHWSDTFYYALCRDVVMPANPPTTSCLNLGNGSSAKVILIGPGSPFIWQNRSVRNIANYLENENAAAPLNNIFQQTPRSNHTANFNDLIKIVAP